MNKIIKAKKIDGTKKNNCLLNGVLKNPPYSSCDMLFKTTRPIIDKMLTITMILIGSSLYCKEEYLII
tara:strand:+ start:733 stop:936 length:204 start_codon:yes stop_codon:yes gene_type:complete